MKSLIVGLGNPGREYEDTRHNVGWMILDAKANGKTPKEQFKGIYWDDGRGDDRIGYLKPMTFMNLSGQSVAQAVQFYKVNVNDILVVHDELDLPFGTLMLKKGGGLAGHNGLKSIAALLGSQDFLRLRVGIGRPQHGSVSSWVLSAFSGDEEIALSKVIQVGIEAIDSYLNEGFDKAAKLYSKKNVLI